MDSTSNAGSKEAVKTFLVGSVADTERFLNCCPTATSLICTEITTGLDAVIAIPCRRWGCRHCGQRKAFGLAIKCELAEPNRFITLTVDPKRYINPREAYDATRRRLADFNKAVRKQVGQFEYLRVLEATKKGWPHYHFLAKCPYIPQHIISGIWGAMTGAPIVDIRRIEKGTNVFKYVLKYLCKQQYIPWTTRRVSWSRSFFPPKEQTEKPANPFTNRTRYILHPATALAKQFTGRTIEQRRPGVWVVTDSDCETAQGRLPVLEKEAWHAKQKTPPSSICKPPNNHSSKLPFESE